MEALISSMIASGPLANRPPHILLLISCPQWRAFKEKTARMTSGPESSEKLPNPQKSRLRSLAPAAVFGILALVALSVAVLYGMSGLPGKESAASGSKTCAAAADRLPAIAAAATGEVAALAPAKTPRPALDLAFLGPEGQSVKLSDLRGKAILLNLWATWCVPCREEMPALDRLQAQAGGPDFEVVTLNIDTARLERRQAFLTEIGVKSLRFYTDPSADVFQVLKRAGKVVGLPTTILIDAQGCELGILAGAATWDSPDALKLVAALRKSGS
jgi:thiol-disulfide isomerase/thioredoxin